MERGIEEVRAVLLARLQERRAEIEEGALRRTLAIAEAGADPDPGYAGGLQAAVIAAVDCGLRVIEQDEGQPVPPALLAQARTAAGRGVGLDIVLRRYFAGFTLFADFVMQAGEDSGEIPAGALHRLLRSLTAEFDRIVEAISEEYERERENCFRTPERRRVAKIKRLVEGAPVDASSLDYDFEAWHLGLIVNGPRAAEVVRELARPLGQPLLMASEEEGVVWAWLGGRYRDSSSVARQAAAAPAPDVSLTLGEPGYGLTGWRLTHRQASAALTVLGRGGETLVRYADTGLLACILQDDLAMDSLRQMYLVPLVGAPDGQALCETLQAYFTAERNVSSAAAALGISRRTVATRLRTAEELLDRPLGTVAAELEAVLRLNELEVRDRVIQSGSTTQR